MDCDIKQKNMTIKNFPTCSTVSTGNVWFPFLLCIALILPMGFVGSCALVRDGVNPKSEAQAQQREITASNSQAQTQQRDHAPSGSETRTQHRGNADRDPEIKIIPISPYDFPFGYPFPDYPLMGASPMTAPRDYMAVEPPLRQIKRLPQYALRLIQTDRVEEAVAYTNKILTDHPNLMDEEMLFMRAMAQAQLGLLDDAAASMEEAIERAELPPQRFLAGPRRLFAPLHDHEAFISLWQDGANDLVHGPMLGAMTDRSVTVWVRTVSETPVRIAISRHADRRDAWVTDAVMSRADQDYTAEITIDGLEPDTRYYYSVLLGAGRHEISSRHQSFRTYPAAGESSRFQVAFGGCSGFVPFNERMWDVIRRFEPLAMLTLGDNVYIDDPESPDQQHLMYYQRQSRPEYRRLVSSTPIYAIWDDHDFGMDDSEGGPEVDVPYWKPMVLDIFRQNWVNPQYGNPDRPGVWFDFQLADVHFILLDGRYYRESAGRWGDGERIENASMLGPHQMEWLKKTLTESDATFKVLVSPVPFHEDAKGEGIRRLDGWAGYLEEREEIFSWIRDHKVEGVVLVSSDRHRSDAWKLERSDSYDLYEFNSGQITNQHTHGLIEGSLFGFNETNSFGLLTFDTVASDPEVTYQIVDIDGYIQETLTISLSQLK